MTLEEMLKATRIRLDDTLPEFKWSDDELIGYINEAQVEAARRARLIVDSTTDEITLLALPTGEASVALDPRVIFIRRARVIGRPVPLRKASYKDLDCRAPGWEDHAGEPREYVADFDTTRFRPYPTPDADAQARLTVIREPLKRLENDGDEPEIAPRYHLGMLHWVDRCARLKPDAETLNKAKAMDAELLFEQEFGKKSTAQDEVWIEREQGYVDDGAY